jgi:hypothetical protein
MLYMCALDAQTHGRKDIGITVLKKILRDYDDIWMTEEAKNEIRLPVLIRFLLTTPGVIVDV